MTPPTLRQSRSREARTAAGGRRVDVVLDREAAAALDGLCASERCGVAEAVAKAVLGAWRLRVAWATALGKPTPGG